MPKLTSSFLANSIKTKSAILTKEQILSLRGIPLSELLLDQSSIPTGGGIYIFKYWPNLDHIQTQQDIVDFIYGEIPDLPKIKEQIFSNRVLMNLQIRAFGSYGIGDKPASILGLSEGKRLTLSDHLTTPENIDQFKCLLNLCFSFLSPVYVGKAYSLQDRISDHCLTRSSNLLEEISNLKLRTSDVTCAVMSISLGDKDDKTADALLTTYENIIQSLVHPILTKRYG